MATQYTSILKLALPTTGELDGTWGDVVNNNITSMVEEAIAGLSTINTWTTNSHTLTTANGTTSESRAAILVLTDTGGALTGAGEVICPNASKVYIVKNDTGETITVKTSAGTGVEINDGVVKIVICDGTNVINAGSVELNVNAPVGTNNVLLGATALDSMVSGERNTAVGSGALSSWTGDGNTAFGYNALNASTGGANVAVGHKALESLISGTGNVGIGDEVLTDATSGYNTAVGFKAGVSITTGSANTLVGEFAGPAISIGFGNTCIGNTTGFGGTLTTGSNNTLLGYNAEPSTPTVSNQITLGNSSITSLRCNVTTISSLSDQRDKVNIVDSQYGLETLEKVKVRQFDWATRRGSIKDGTSEIGFIAQELQEVGDNNLLKLVMDDNPEFLEASPASLIPILVKAVQELSEKVKELESR
jgi:hypothetical protein